MTPLHTCTLSGPWSEARHALQESGYGSEAGGVKVWNFSSGACISELATSSQKEVTSIAAVHGSMLKHFMVAGWDRAVTLYEDSAARKIGPGRGHRSDVLDMALMEKYPTLVTACDDGDIWAWNCDSVIFWIPGCVYVPCHNPKPSKPPPETWLFLSQGKCAAYCLCMDGTYQSTRQHVRRCAFFMDAGVVSWRLPTPMATCGCGSHQQVYSCWRSSLLTK
eukprot:303980-Chlamydomonas_euryale.AAC.8